MYLPKIKYLSLDQRLITAQKNLTVEADDRHESILKVVSSTLTSNVGKLLEQTVKNTCEKSILPHINTTVKKSVDSQLSKTLAGHLEKTFPKELRGALNDAVHKALFDNDAGVKFSETISKAVVSKLETTLQKDISSRLGGLIEKILGPLIAKLEERLQTSIETSIQRIQEETRESQRETVKKLEDLSVAISKITEYIKNETPNVVIDTKSPATSASQIAAQQFAARMQTMAEQFKAGKYSSGIETVFLPSNGTDVKWSDSSDTEQAALFAVCAEYDYSFLNNVEQLTLMSAANAVSIDLKTHLEERLQWLEKIVALAKREAYSYSSFLI